MSEPFGGQGIELRHLRYVLALAEQRSFRRAAASLAIPPRALSREIARIERALGTRLFQRLPGKAVPTPAGDEIARLAREALASRIAESQDLAGEGATLEIGCLDYGRGQAVQRAAVVEFQAQYPHVAVHLVPIPFHEQARAVGDGSLGAGFSSGTVPALPGLRAHAMHTESMGSVLLPAGHPLAELTELTLGDLSGIPLNTCSVRDSPEVAPRMLDAVARGGWHGRLTSVSALPSGVMALVACGAGWAPVPSALAGWAPAGLVVVPLAEGPLTRYDRSVVWRDEDPLASAFVRLVRDLHGVIDTATHPQPPPRDRDRPSVYRALLTQRYAERARIARELHDTLLQDVSGSHLQLEALRRRLPPALESESRELQQVVERLERAAREGRGVLRNLWQVRSSTTDLALALSGAAEQLREGSPVEFRMKTSGAPRDLHAWVEESAYQVGVEAVTNALRHGSPAVVSVSLDYRGDRFRLRVRDDGVGIDPGILRAGGRPGCRGLALMRERADGAGGRLVLRREPGAGTTVELVVPGRSAFAEHTAGEVPRPAPAAPEPQGGDGHPRAADHPGDG